MSVGGTDWPSGASARFAATADLPFARGTVYPRLVQERDRVMTRGLARWPRLQQLLASPRAVVLAAALGALLCAASVPSGFATEDYLFRAGAQLPFDWSTTFVPMPRRPSTGSTTTMVVRTPAIQG